MNNARRQWVGRCRVQNSQFSTAPRRPSLDDVFGQFGLGTHQRSNQQSLIFHLSSIAPSLLYILPTHIINTMGLASAMKQRNDAAAAGGGGGFGASTGQPQYGAPPGAGGYASPTGPPPGGNFASPAGPPPGVGGYASPTGPPPGVASGGFASPAGPPPGMGGGYGAVPAPAPSVNEPSAAQISAILKDTVADVRTSRDVI